MDDDRYFHNRGNFARSSAAPSDVSISYAQRRQHNDSYSHNQQQQYHKKQQLGFRTSESEPNNWDSNTVASWRSPPTHAALDAPGPSRHHSQQHVTHRSRPENSPHPSPSSQTTLSSHSEWLILPSVSHALGMYGDKRRTEPRFSLVIRQQPRRGLAIGNSQMSLRTARSVPIDPPPVCELLIDRSGDEQLLSLPEIFIRAQLVRGDSPMEECLPDARRIEPLVGDTLQSPFNSRIDTREDQSFFVFKELGVRGAGVYKLRFDLFDRIGLRIFKITSVYSDAFEVQERRKHPGLCASSALMDALVDRGMKYKLRKANDKQNPKKRKSPEDFHYGDERSISGTRRQSYATEERSSRHFVRGLGSSSIPTYGDRPQQVVRPIPHRTHSGERINTVTAAAVEDRREFSQMLPSFNNTVGAGVYVASPSQGYQGSRLSPPLRIGDGKAPQLPSLSRPSGTQPLRPYLLPQLHLSSQHLPAPQQLSRSQWGAAPQEAQNNRARQNSNGARLSHMTGDAKRPSLELRLSSSSVSTSYSTGREASASGSNTTPGSSVTENNTPFSFTTTSGLKPLFDGQDRQSSSSNAFGLGALGKFEVDSANSHLNSISKITNQGRRDESNNNSTDRQLIPPPSSSSSSSLSSSPSNSMQNRPTLPPISFLYNPIQTLQLRSSSNH
ncbi:uncharacterized protein MEPE_03680 [Melanopsichium pennsylvanicum]|uniref:Velvet domain-containing protein n=2 Tax=Melanopsichium pennsylvanicum TaxID=63383 RepID=A0AAJ4XND0_9BASI|nr:conserved hypothetical protein (N-terminal fragment) [Melanopsichium pennsylvanicum 4]SNX84971.1 uncharacterized protein MEPE_03680 [Melanopsichium pennsylvanicum]